MGTEDDLEEGTKHLMINVKIHKENKDNLVECDDFIVSKAINLTYIGFFLLYFDRMQLMISAKSNESSYLYNLRENILKSLVLLGLWVKLVVCTPLRYTLFL